MYLIAFFVNNNMLRPKSIQAVGVSIGVVTLVDSGAPEKYIYPGGKETVCKNMQKWKA